MTMSRLDLYMAVGQIDRYEYYSKYSYFKNLLNHAKEVIPSQLHSTV